MNPEAIILSLIGGVVSLVSLIFGLRSKANESRLQTELGLAQTAQKSEEQRTAHEDSFRATVLTELKRTQERMELLSEKHNALALEHATLMGQVQVLQSTREALTVENARLLALNVQLSKDVLVLAADKVLLGNRVSELSGKLAVLAPISTPALTPGAAV